MRRHSLVSGAVVSVAVALFAWGCPPDDTGGNGGGDTDETSDAEEIYEGDGTEGDVADGGGDADACMPSNNGVEICDNKDNDCDGETDECCKTWYKDDDEDGYGEDDEDTNIEACGDPGDQYAEESGDCDDLDSSINPGAEESRCDGVDEDCDGEIDEGEKTTYYTDEDTDGYGDESKGTQDACSSPGEQWATDKGDCDDKDSARNPGQTEICGDGVDNDCDQDVDEGCGSTCYRDKDGDGFGVTNDTGSCSSDDYAQNSGDCNDSDTADGRNQYPGNTEVCDGLDNDCDGDTDECCKTYYHDKDGDTYGDPQDSKRACSQPTDYVENKKDCLDSDKKVYEGQTQYFALTNNAGGWDYNCDNQKGRRYTDDNPDCSPPACQVDRGWADGADDGQIPDCGQDGRYLTACSGNAAQGCNPQYDQSRTQRCR